MLERAMIEHCGMNERGIIPKSSRDFSGNDRTIVRKQWHRNKRMTLWNQQRTRDTSIWNEAQPFSTADIHGEAPGITGYLIFISRAHWHMLNY